MANLIGALVGAAIDRQDGDSGIKGALIGTVAESAVRVALPLVATYAVGWGVIYGAKKLFGALSNRERERTPAR